MSRPSETVSAVAASVLGALLIIFGSFNAHWVEKITPEVMGAIVLLVGWVGALVTWYISKKQRDPNDPTGSANDGSVTS